MLNFNELGLISPLLAAVEKQGYERPTPIQQQAIPQILQKKDLFAIAPTGTGKTAAFAMPILQDIMENPQREPHALVLAPTRELAHQIADNFRKYAEGTKLYIALVYGGVSQINQVKDIRRGAHIIIATPGRLLDLIEQGHINLSKVKTFVLDECDRMLDMGFIADIREIGNLIKTENRQTLLFSATAAKEIRDLAADMLVEPAYIDIAPENHQKPNINQFLYAVDRNNKYSLLKNVMEEMDMDSVLVFTKTKHGADRLVQYLHKDNYSAVAIHGDKSQRERSKNLDLFKKGRAQILVATDVAARGVDVKELNYVLNYDMALDTDTHTHRIGRTGRAGAEGNAISFCDDNEARFLRDILKQHGQDSMQMMEHEFHIEIPWRKPPQKGRRSESGDSGRGGRGGRNQGRSSQGEGNSFGGSSNGGQRRDGKGAKKSFQPFSDSFNFDDSNSQGNRGSEFRVIDGKKSKNKKGAAETVNPTTGNKPTKNLNKEGSNFDDMEFLIMDELFKERSSLSPRNTESKEKGNNKKTNSWGSTRKNDGGEFFSENRSSGDGRRSGGGRDFNRGGNSGGSGNRFGNRNGGGSGNRAERRNAEFGGDRPSNGGFGRNNGGRSSGGFGGRSEGGRSEGGFSRNSENGSRGGSRGGFGGGFGGGRSSNGGGYGRNTEGGSRGGESRGGESRGGEFRSESRNGGNSRGGSSSNNFSRGGSSSRSGSSFGGNGRSGGPSKNRRNPAGHKNKYKAGS